MNLNKVITDYNILSQSYIIREGYEFKTVTHPGNVYDAIVIKNVSNPYNPNVRIRDTGQTLEEQIAFVNKHKLEKAIIVADDIYFITRCPTLHYIEVIPSAEENNFDFSPLYEMPEIKSLQCSNLYGIREQYISKIDYLRIKGLISLSVHENKGALNYNKVNTLKSLLISGFKGKNRDLTDLFCSKELDTLHLIQCGIQSLNGIDTSNKMQCLYLDYNRSLRDISALSKVKNTLKLMRLDNCPKIEDFSVLGELENLELLELTGSNALPNLNFLKTMKNLKFFVFDMNVLDGDLTSCLKIPYVYCGKNCKHYNLKDKDLTKVFIVRGNESIDEWRRRE